MKKSNIIIILITVLSFLAGIYFYPQMPDKMASHWDSRGQVDGYLPKFWGLFLMPIISLAVFLLFLLIPKIDPLKKNINKFRKYFDWFIVLTIFFLLYIYSLSLVWNLGYRFDMGQLMTPALGFLFLYIGVLLKHVKRNWFIGIRTPWTLSSDVVWNKTHQLGSKLFKLAGIVALFGILIPSYTLWPVLIPVISFSFYLLVYSYFEYRKIEK